MKPTDLLYSLSLPIEDRLHALRVAEPFSTGSNEHDVCYTVAVCHDLVEDGYTDLHVLERLLNLTSQQVAALDAITRREGERYFDYIARVKQNEIARKVKLADLTDNIKRCSGNLPERWGLLRRYAKAYGILIDQWKEYNGGTEK